MMFETPADWVPSSIITDSGLVEGFRGPGTALDEACEFLAPFLEGTWIANGTLLRHEHEGVPPELVILPGNVIGHRSILPTSEMWFFPQCDFLRALTLLSAFGFPSDRCVRQSHEVLREVVNLLSQMARHRVMGVINVSPTTILIGMTKSSPAFSEKEMDAVMQLNESRFAVSHSEEERNDLKMHYIKARICVIGET